MKEPEETGFTSTIRILASRWAGAGILLRAFPLLARGQPLEIDEIARAAGVGVDRITTALDAARCVNETIRAASSTSTASR